MQAALTGHLVFSTLHTNDASTSITRLIDLGIHPFLISSTLIGAMAQRLMRKICPDCKQNRPLTVEEASMLNLQAPAGKRIIVKEGAGCIRCRNMGYFGRTGIFEILPIDNAMRDLIDRGEDFLKIGGHGHGDDQLRRSRARYGDLTARANPEALLPKGQVCPLENGAAGIAVGSLVEGAP